MEHLAEVNRKGGECAQGFGNRHADSGAPSAGQTGFSPPHRSSSVQEKTPDLCCEALTLTPPTNNVRIRRKRLSDVQTHRRFKCRLFSTVSLSSQSGYSRRSKARIPGVRCGNVPRNMPTRKLLRVLLDFVSGHIHGEFSDRRGRVQLS